MNSLFIECYFHCLFHQNPAASDQFAISLFSSCRSAWRKEQYTLGSYCYIPVGGSAEDIERLADPVHDEDDKVSEERGEGGTLGEVPLQ